MSRWIALRIMDTKDREGLEAAQEKYRAYFINTSKASAYKAETDDFLVKEGYENCIVE